MKTKIKRHSRSVISVILAVCMLVSCMTAGIIATDAAKVDSEVVGTTGNEKLYIGQSSTGLAYVDTINTTPKAHTLKQYNNWINICWDNSTAWNNSYVWYNNDAQKPRWDISGATGVNSISVVDNSNCYYILINVKSEATYYFSVTGTNASDLTLVLTGGPDPVCSNLELTASNSALTSTTDTFTLTATATDVKSGSVTYKFYSNDGTLVDTVTSSNGTATTSALTQATKSSQKYYVTAELSGCESKTSDKITVTNSAVSGTKTIYVGVISYIMSNWYSSNPTGLILNELKLHYWGGDGNDPEDATPTYTGTPKTKDVGYWSEAQTFTMYKFTVPTNYVSMQAWIDGDSDDHWFGSGDSISDYNTIYIFNYSGDKALYANETYTTSTLTLDTVANATVTATYNGTTIQEGGEIEDIPAGDSVTINVTPDKGYECAQVTSTETATITGSGTAYTLTMPAADTTVSADITTVAWKRVYFNNYYTRYAMVSAYVKYSDGTEPLGAWSGQTMTRIENTNTWYIEVPGDIDYIAFIGDNGYNTGKANNELLTIPWDTYTAPKYTAGTDPTNPSDGGTWGEYVARTNEYVVSDGTTLENSNLFTGITATLYDYYVDGEAAAGNWLSGIGSREYSQNNGNNYNWNPFTTLDDALDDYARKFAVQTYPLYFGNLNTTNGTDSLITVASGTYKDETYYSWNYAANNSNGLGSGNGNQAVYGLTGQTLANGNIHYYKSGNTNENGAIMAMFDEDFLSGENMHKKALASILRTSTFPVRKSTIAEKPTVLYLDTSGFDAWEANNAVIKADFYNGSTTESTKALVTATKVANHIYKVSIPSGYTKVQWWRMNPSSPNGTPWNYGTEDAIPSDENCVYKLSNWNKSGSWGTDSNLVSLNTHVYYEFDSTDGKDNAYITNINKTDHTATIDYYDGTTDTDKRVYAAGIGKNGGYGFFPFDGNSLNNNLNGMAHDLGFGMKLEIPFTLEQNGEFSDGTHQIFDFSGDDDLWVFVDNQLVLDLGGAHNKTTGSIDFADKTVTASATQAALNFAGTRNGSFDWFDNSNPNQPHTLTIYYMERGMYDSNLKFGFSFHAIPNQFKSEKKVRTANINSGFYNSNNQTGDASNESTALTIREGRFISKFEESYQNEVFNVLHTVGGNPITGKEYTIGSTTSTVGSNSTYQLKNDEIAYFLGQFEKGDSFTLTESADTSNLYNYAQSVAVYDDANNGKVITGTGTATSGYTFSYTPTTTVTVAEGGLENINIRARFTNQMLSHNLTITKNVTGEYNSETFTLRILFKFGNDGYISYPLNCTVDGVSTVLGNDGTITISKGQIINIPKIPENAKVQIEEININSNYNFEGITLSGATGTNITNGMQFAVGETDITATVGNNRFSGITIAKELKYSPQTGVLVDYLDNTSEFRIKVETSANGSVYTPLANTGFTSSDTSRTTNLTTDAYGIATIKRGEKLSFEGLTSNEYVRVTEDTQDSTYSNNDYSVSDHMPLDYQFKEATAVKGGTDTTADSYNKFSVEGNYYHGCTFQLTVNRVDVTITNMKPRYRWIAKYKHQTRSVDIANPSVDKKSIWGDVWYHSEGVFTAEELLAYTKFAIVTPASDSSQAGSTVKGIEFADNDAKAAFLLNKTPYQDNFKETVTWDLSGANVGFYYNESEGSQLSITPLESLNNDEKVDVSFRLPCKMSLNNQNDEWLPVETVNGESALVDGVPKAKLIEGGLPDESSVYFTDYVKNDADYANWYCINDAKVGQSSKTPQFISAPEKVYDVDKQAYQYFQYWSVRTMTNDSGESVEYTRCYNKDYNYVFYQNSIVYAVYGDVQQSGYDVARATENSVNLTFLENSRNQWNVEATGAQIKKDFGENNVNYGDRVFSDFVIDLHYVKDGQNLLLNSVADPENYRAGLLIETVRELNATEVDTVNRKMLKTDKQIAESFKSSENIAARNAALEYLKGPMTDKTKYLNSSIAVTKFDNKNELEYAYSLANISQTKEYRSETTRKMQVYRAYAYLINTGAGTDSAGNPDSSDVMIISEPIYFTIYDIASIANDYDLAMNK